MYEKLKKLNAVLGLLAIALLISHAGYSAVCYAFMIYNPGVTKIFAGLLMLTVCLHAVLGMSLVFLHSDGTDLTVYKGYNKSTIAQRISAALIFPLLLLHVRTFSIMQSAAEAGAKAPIVLMILIEILFFGTVFTHVATSFSRALITLGLLTSPEKQRRIDKALRIICALMFAICVIVIVRTQLVMFMR